MKLAIFTDTYYPDINGVAKTLKRLTDYLDQQNIAYKIFAPKTTTNDYVSENIHRFESLSFFLYPECRLALPNLPQIKKELRSFSPDLIHVATPFNIGLCGVYYAKKFNIPLVGSYHTNFDQYLHYYDLPFLSKLVWKYMSWFHQPFEKLFVPSMDTLEQLKERQFSHLEIWPRGVNCQQFHPHYDTKTIREKWGIKKKYLLTYVGRLAPEKKVNNLLSIEKLLPPSYAEQIDWLIVGDGPMRKGMEKDAPHHMKFTGYRNGTELAEIYSAADLFVFPSPTETFGNVALESLASGTPVVGANSGGVKHVVQQGVTGFLCEPGDDQEFADSIVKLLSHDSLRWQMGSEGHQYALTQRWDQIFENLLAQYQEVIEKQGNRKYA